jgi:hypothetical protein
VTREEVVRLLLAVRMVWPHSSLGEDPNQVINLWFSFFETVPLREAEEAVKEMAVSRDHAPGPGILLRSVMERANDAPDWDVAWEELRRLIRSRGSWSKPRPEDFSHLALAAFALPAWEELCRGPAEGTSGFGTHYAQQREAYGALRNRATRDLALLAVSAPRVGSVTAGGMRRLDVTRMLPGGDPDGHARS